MRDGKRLFKLNPLSESGSNAAFLPPYLFTHLKPFHMIQIQLKQHHTKGEIIKFACNNDPDKIRNIDVAIPLEWVNQNPDLAHFWYIMDYNKNPIFGEVKDLITLAEENGVKLILPPKTPDHEKGS